MENRDAQIQQMYDFIIQEAKEKVNEIHLKTSHDSNLEKQMTVHNAKSKIQKDFKEKSKQLETEQRIKLSRAEAQYRVKKMRVREELLNEVKGAAVAELQKVTNDKTKYQQLLKELIVQGLIKLNESKVEVIVRECDVALASAVKDAAAKEYIDLIKSSTGQTASANLEVNPGGKCLPPPADGSGKESCAGGVKLLGSQGRIVCDNTLDSRLAVSFEELMPEIRSSLFSTRV